MLCVCVGVCVDGMRYAKVVVAGSCCKFGVVVREGRQVVEDDGRQIGLDRSMVRWKAIVASTMRVLVERVSQGSRGGIWERGDLIVEFENENTNRWVGCFCEGALIVRQRNRRVNKVCNRRPNRSLAAERGSVCGWVDGGGGRVGKGRLLGRYPVWAGEQR